MLPPRVFRGVSELGSDDAQEISLHRSRVVLQLGCDVSSVPPRDAHHPEHAVAIEAMAIGRTPKTPQYNDLIGDLNGPWTLMIQSAIFDEDIDTAVKKAHRQFQKIMDE